jgi:hypothetical protein
MRTLILRLSAIGGLLALAAVILLLTGAPAFAVSLPGDQLWQKKTAVSSPVGFVEMARGPGGTVYAVGTRAYTSGGKKYESILLVKYSPAGKLLWKRSLASGVVPNSGSGRAIAADAAGNVTVAGIRGTATQAYDIVVACYSPSGALRWSHTYNGPADGIDQVFDVALDRSGGAYVAGSVATKTQGSDILLLKYAAGGRRLWKYSYNSPALQLDDYAQAVAVDRSGAAYVTGYSQNMGGATWSAPVLKVSAAGKPIWLPHLLVGSSTFATRIALDGNGNVVVAGRCLGATDYDLFVAKLTPKVGSLVWTPKTIAVAGNQNLNDLAIGRCHNDIYLVGSCSFPVSTGEIAKFKYDGTQRWNTHYWPDNVVNGGLSWNAVALDARDDLYVAGRDSATSPATDTFEVGKLEWDGTWPIWQKRVPGDATGDTTPRDILWTGGSSGGAYACGVMTQGGIDYAYITRFKP